MGQGLKEETRATVKNITFEDGDVPRKLVIFWRIIHLLS
jgi:hypothetical protein